MNWVAAFVLTDEKPKFSIHVIHPTLVAKVLFVATVIFIWLPFLILTSHMIMIDKRQLKWWIMHKSFLVSHIQICTWSTPNSQISATAATNGTMRLQERERAEQFLTERHQTFSAAAAAGSLFCAKLCKQHQRLDIILVLKKYTNCGFCPSRILSTVCVSVHWRDISCFSNVYRHICHTNHQTTHHWWAIKPFVMGLWWAIKPFVMENNSSWLSLHARPDHTRPHYQKASLSWLFTSMTTRPWPPWPP